MRYFLLNPSDIHSPGDEIWIDQKWLPVGSMHHGDPVGESFPCRRKLSRAGLLKLAKAESETHPPSHR